MPLRGPGAGGIPGSSVEDLSSRLPLLLASPLEEVVVGAVFVVLVVIVATVRLSGAHGAGTCCTYGVAS